MKIKNLNISLFKLPSDIEFTLFLIKEELKSNYLINSLCKVGFDDSYHRSDLSSVILANIGFEDPSDELREFYYKLLDQYSERVGEDYKKIVKHAFNLYVDMVIEKRKQVGAGR